MTLKNHTPGGCCCDSSTTCFLVDEDFSNRSGPDDIGLPSYYNTGNYKVNVGGEYLQPSEGAVEFNSVGFDFRYSSDQGTADVRDTCGFQTKSFSYTFWVSPTDENSMFSLHTVGPEIPYGIGNFRTTTITLSNAGINYWGRAASTVYNPWGGWGGGYYLSAWYDTAACWQAWQDLKDLEPDNELYADTARYLSPEPQTHPFRWVPNSQTKVEFRFGKVLNTNNISDKQSFDYVTQRGKGDFVEGYGRKHAYVAHGTVQLYVNDRFVLSTAGSGRDGRYDPWGGQTFDFDGGPDWEAVSFCTKPPGGLWECFIRDNTYPSDDDYMVFVRPSSKPEPTSCNIHRITQTVSVLAEEPPPRPPSAGYFGKVHLCSDFSRDNSGCSYNKAGSTPLFRGLHRPSRVRVTNTEDFYFRNSDSFGPTTSKIWLPGGYVYELYPDGQGETYRRILEEDEYIQLQVSGPPQIATYWLTGFSLMPFQAPSPVPYHKGDFVVQNNMIVYLSWASKSLNPDTGEDEYSYANPGWGMLSNTVDLLDKSISTIDFTTHYFDSRMAMTPGLSINNTGGDCKALIDY